MVQWSDLDFRPFALACYCSKMGGALRVDLLNLLTHSKGIKCVLKCICCTMDSRISSGANSSPMIRAPLVSNSSLLLARQSLENWHIQEVIRCSLVQRNVSSSSGSLFIMVVKLISSEPRNDVFSSQGSGFSFNSGIFSTAALIPGSHPPNGFNWANFKLSQNNFLNASVLKAIWLG